jgi:flagellar hook-basal body complex protein FliE
VIAPIQNIAPIGTPQMASAATAAGQPGDFQSVLSSAINSIDGLQQSAADSVQKFLTGQNEELHTTVLANQKAELSFELGLQVRNKVVDAYQEIMKMQM